MRVRHNIGISKRFQGLGFMVDLDAPVAMRRIPLSVQVKFLWFYYWFILEGKEI